MGTPVLRTHTHPLAGHCHDHIWMYQCWGYLVGYRMGDGMKLTLYLILAGLSAVSFLIGMATNMDILSWSVVPL